MPQILRRSLRPLAVLAPIVAAHPVLADDFGQPLRLLGIGAEPSHCCQFIGVGLVAWIARTISDVVEEEAGIALVGEIGRNPAQRMRRQEADRLFGDRQATGNELFVVDAAHRHQQGARIVRIAFKFVADRALDGSTAEIEITGRDQQDHGQ